MRHDYHDRVSLEIARRVASELPSRPEWLDLARSNLDRWSQINSTSPTLLACYAEWRELLCRPVGDICAALLEQSDQGQRRRQSSPFAGVLSAPEVWNIKERIRHEQNAA